MWNPQNGLVWAGNYKWRPQPTNGRNRHRYLEVSEAGSIMAKDSFEHGTLFAQDYLEFGICEDPDWGEVSPEELANKVRPIYERFPYDSDPNESTTENELIWPVLEALGWSSYLRQQNLSMSGRNLIPDGLLFLDEVAKEQANSQKDEWRRYRSGVALVESKRWNQDLALDKGFEGENGGVAAATQMLYYLRRADVLTEGSLQWGILTDGEIWRLYWQGAKSVADQYFQINLAELLGFDWYGAKTTDRSPDETAEDLRWLRIFGMMFRRKAFAQSGASLLTVHQRAVSAGRYYESRVSKNLSERVFSTVFPALANAISAAAPDASLVEVRDSALTFMYRLLFLFFAEDRGFMPVEDSRYKDYSLRDNVRMDVKRRLDANETFSNRAARYWSVVDELSRLVEGGDASIGLPPYNGGLFDLDKTPLLSNARIADDIMARIIEELSFDGNDNGGRYINYKDLSVQHLGSIYESLLEFELRQNSEKKVTLHPNPYARKSSGSYYTPDELIRLVVEETMKPIIQDCKKKFYDKIEELRKTDTDKKVPRRLRKVDPASSMIKIRVCDPAMGSGPFLVHFVDYLSDQIMGAIIEAQTVANREGYKKYRSPLFEIIDKAVDQIEDNAEKNGWAIADAQIMDHKIVRRMVLKRCVYGVDKNEMAVELTKVSLWLHSFTVGAPLSFIDHHLRCGDSLFGEWVQGALDRIAGHTLFVEDAIREAQTRAHDMHALDLLNDVEIAETRDSAMKFECISKDTRPLNLFMQVIHAIRWMMPLSGPDAAAVDLWLDGKFGNPIDVILLKWNIITKEYLATKKYCEWRPRAERQYVQPEPEEENRRFQEILDKAKTLLESEGFLNWEVAFPGVWSQWERGRVGGFDAVIGNPPWDRIKFQQVEWLAAREPDVARVSNADERRKRIERVFSRNKQLESDWSKAAHRAERMSYVARKCGAYPMMSGGDINIYSLFVERSMSLLKPGGMIGLLTPSGVASDKTASKFFTSIASERRLCGLYDFSNKQRFFQDVTSQFKFCALIASKTREFQSAKCAFFLESPKELLEEDRVLHLSAEDFDKFNPNTGTVPVFRTRRDFEITSKVYSSQPVLANLSSGKGQFAWPVRQHCMFHMTNNSDKFRTSRQLMEGEGAWAVEGGRWQSKDGMWMPLYVGKMFHQFDHRAASVEVNEKNIHNAALSDRIPIDNKMDVKFTITPQYWVNEAHITFQPSSKWLLVYRDVARVTDSRTMIASAIPRTAVGNTAPILTPVGESEKTSEMSLLLGNLNSIALDYVGRQKVQSTHLNWYIVEQLPVVPREIYKQTKFGGKGADEIVKEAVVELTYTSNDMAPFAIEQGYVDRRGKARKPFKWNEMRRLRLKAKLDAVYFHLYGIFDPRNREKSRDDIIYIYSTFPIVEKQEMKTYGRYLSRDMALAYCNALDAGEPDAEPVVEPAKQG